MNSGGKSFRPAYSSLPRYDGRITQARWPLICRQVLLLSAGVRSAPRLVGGGRRRRVRVRSAFLIGAVVANGTAHCCPSFAVADHLTARPPTIAPLRQLFASAAPAPTRTRAAKAAERVNIRIAVSQLDLGGRNGGGASLRSSHSYDPAERNVLQLTSVEQVTEHLPAEQRAPAPSPMLRPECVQQAPVGLRLRELPMPSLPAS